MSSCTRPCYDYNVVGADEFVTDSYQIKQGKAAILEMMGLDPGVMPPDALKEYRDVIEEGDVFNIALFHPTRADLREAFEYINTTMEGFHVREGMIDLPDIPSIYVIGLTKKDAQDKINEELQKHYANAEIFISFKDREKQKVKLAGLVEQKSILVNGKMRLFDVLTQANYNPNANLFLSYVMRDGQFLAVDIYKLMNEGDMCQNIVMKGGDKIYIANPKDAPVLVMGEVEVPIAVPVPYGFISLPEALVAARGIPFTGDRQNIQIIRGDLTCPKIYVVCWDHVINLPNSSMLLMPGDTVFISEKPITKWNRFISQLTPTAGGVLTGYAIYELFQETK